MVLEQHRALLAQSVAAVPVIALFVVSVSSCSDESTPGGSGGAAAGGGGNAGSVATGGSPMTTGGAFQATGGVAAATGGAAAASGGTSTGGASTGGAAVGGAPSGGAAAMGGTSAGTSGEGGATPDGANPGGAAGAGGAQGGAGGSSGGGAAGGGAGASGGSGGGAPSTRSPGCGKTTARPNRRTQQTMQIAGATRYYLLDVPENDGQMPMTLVFGVHGFDMNNVAVIDLFNFTSRSNGKAITVLPQGEGPPPGDTSHWGDQVLKSTWGANAANYEFIQALKTDIEEKYCVDPSREFISGFSMGGFFTNALACEHPDWFRAFAPVAGGGPMGCTNANAKPAIMIHHGTADDIVTIDNGEGSRDFWRERNACETAGKSSFSGCTSYDGCPEQSPVVWCIGNFNHTINSTTAANIWSFFSGLK
jgi:polyhydroxybutyrate depolymerase